MGLPDGLPFLLSPRFEYDVALNSYFLRANLRVAPWNSNANRARALARFLNFLHVARGNKPWQAATEADHLAFHQWRRREESGPRVEGSTWNQEVSLVNQFYEWAVSEGHSAVVPIPHRRRRPAPAGTVVRGRESITVPATFAHDESGERTEWLPRTRRVPALPDPRLHRPEVSGDVVGHAVGMLQLGPGHIVQAGERVVIRHSSRSWHTRIPSCDPRSVQVSG
ncbi:site-specific integrase [Streptomyces sp. LN704]|uniref:site-specific integrase n=1 Tax=Streptomyces sp. LN704 TaxID=3112982 RepID=UPI0037143AB6